ncbi:MAG TPA: GDSL-type esterase/lipase family protein [Terriglobales bacterium]|nr:GDSL-type esterase/lipase family protein [Terriglobales bacterium]
MGKKPHTEDSAPIVHNLKRSIFLAIALAVATFAIHTAAIAGGQHQDGDSGQHWVATWATAPGAAFLYTVPVLPAFPGPPTTFAPANIQPDLVFPFPNANTAGATDQTFRSIVKPDLWGNRMRVRFSNVFGTQPVTFNEVTVGLQEYSANVVRGTMTQVTFGGKKSVTIPAGQEIFSDGIRLSWVRGADDPALQGRNLAVSYSVEGSSGPMTHHSGANMTSFITATGSGNHTEDLDVFAFQFTTTSWFFLDAVDVMAPSDTVVICAFGDSITDGTHTTLNINDRWMNTLSRRLHNAYGNKVSIVNEAIGGNRVVNPVNVGAASGPAAVDRLDRDVLGLSGLTDVVWLEGINDLGAGHTTDAIIGGYKNIVGRLHAKGIKVYAGTMTSALGLVNPAEGWPSGGYHGGADNGPVVDGNRLILNGYIRTSGLFDGVEDFDAATLDPATGNMKAVYVPNSQFTQLPWDYLHPNHAGYNAMGEAVDIAPFAPHQH